MIISTNWLADYVQVPGTVDEMVGRLLMAGLNHESTSAAGDDTAVELEVTHRDARWYSRKGGLRFNLDKFPNAKVFSQAVHTLVRGAGTGSPPPQSVQRLQPMRNARTLNEPQQRRSLVGKMVRSIGSERRNRNSPSATSRASSER